MGTEWLQANLQALWKERSSARIMQIQINDQKDVNFPVTISGVDAIP